MKSLRFGLRGAWLIAASHRLKLSHSTRTSESLPWGSVTGGRPALASASEQCWIIGLKGTWAAVSPLWVKVGAVVPSNSSALKWPAEKSRSKPQMSDTDHFGDHCCDAAFWMKVWAVEKMTPNKTLSTP